VKSSEEGKVKVQSGNYVVVSDFGKEKAGKTGLAGSREQSSRSPDELRSSGRPNCLSEEKLAQLLEVYYSRPYSLRKLGDMFGVSRMTVWRVVQEYSMALNEVVS